MLDELSVYHYIKTYFEGKKLLLYLFKNVKLTSVLPTFILSIRSACILYKIFETCSDYSHHALQYIWMIITKRNGWMNYCVNSAADGQIKNWNHFFKSIILKGEMFCNSNALIDEAFSHNSVRCVLHQKSISS